MKPKLSIVKAGGALINDGCKLYAFLRDFANLPGDKILIHGGGEKATELGQRLGVPTRMHDGRRITSAETLELVVQVYAGLINKNLVALLQSHGCNALGLSGADGDVIRAVKRSVKDIDYGFVGDIQTVRAELVEHFLESGAVPVFCAVTHDGQGQLLNTNADTIAAEIAIAMAASYEVSLLYCFTQKAVMLDIEDPASSIGLLDEKTYNDLRRRGIIDKGMIPKLDNCFRALRNGVHRIKIGDGEEMLSGNRDSKATTICL